VKFDTRLGPEGHQQHRVPDVYIENQGAIFLVRPVSAAALAWISEYVADDAHEFESLRARQICPSRQALPVEGACDRR